MCRGPEAVFRLRAFSCHRCFCWLRHRCSCWLRCRCFCWLCHRCSGRRRARPLTGSTAGVSAGCATGVPGAVGPARPLTVRAASFARRVGSKPGPCGLAGALHTGGAWRVVRGVWCVVPGHTHLSPVFAPRTAEHPINFACNFLATISNREFVALELQRFLTWLNLRSIELHATFGGDLAVRWRPPHWWLVVRGVWCVVPGRILLLPRAKHLFPWPCHDLCLGLSG